MALSAVRISRVGMASDEQWCGRDKREMPLCPFSPQAPGWGPPGGRQPPAHRPPALLPSLRRVPPCPLPQPAGELANGPHVSATNGPGQTSLQPPSDCFLHLKAIRVINVFSYKVNNSKTCGVGMKSLPTPAPRIAGPQSRVPSQVPPLRRGWGLLPACPHPCIYTHTPHTRTPHIHTHFIHTTHTIHNTTHMLCTPHVHHAPTVCVFHKWSTRPPIYFILQHVSVLLVMMSCNLVNQSSVECRLNSK